MVYVVERYLPGLHRSDLLCGLSKLTQLREQAGEGTRVRYLGSTIVLRDEACYCQFEGPTEAAVAEANRQAGLPFDRIVAAVTVNPKGAEMSISPSIPATVRSKRGRFISLVAAVAVAAAAEQILDPGRVRVRQRQLDGDVEQRSGIRDLQSDFRPRHCMRGSWPAPIRRSPRRPTHAKSRVDHVADAGGTRRGCARHRLRPAHRQERPDAGLRAGLDEPADAAVHKGDHAAHFAQLAAGAAGHP